MRRILLKTTRKNMTLAYLLMVFSFIYSITAFAETDCGHISGFELSNGNSSITIVDEGEYSLDQFPANAYIDVLISGFSESASIHVKNKDTGQEYTIVENYLPYTFPAGNGAWNPQPGEYEIEAELFKYNHAGGSDCDKVRIEITITNTPSCGQIDGLEFSNGSNTVSIVDGGSYDIASLPYNFYVDVIVSGMTESAFNRITNLDTGVVHTNGENALPYTYPSGNQAWNLGTGTFQFYSEIFRYDGCVGAKCDHTTVTFTIFEQNCGEISSFEFSNGTDNTTIADGGSYDINSLPSDFYIDAMVNGQGESVRLEVENFDTGETYNIIENYVPYTFPAGNAAWFLGTGTFKVKGSLFAGNYCNSTLCDVEEITFTINEQNCGSITGFEFSNFSSDPVITIVDGASYNINNIPSGFNINVLTSGNIESAFNTLTNTDTGEVYTNTENVLPYTFPGATTQVWTLGCGTYKLCTSVYEYDGASGLECDSACISFTLTNCQGPIVCEDTFAGTGTIADSTILIGPTGVETLSVIPNGDAVLSEGVTLGCMVTQGPDLIIRALSNTTDVEISFFGDFKAHLFAYDESTLDLSFVVFGQTTAADVLAVIAANNLCASLEPLGIDFIALPTGIARNAVVDTKDPINPTDVDNTLIVKTEEVIEDASVDIKLYPNPVVNDLNVELLLLDAEVMNYKMIDLNGRQLLSGSFDNSSLGRTKINISKLTNGFYIVTFESNFRKFSKKIQVTK